MRCVHIALRKSSLGLYTLGYLKYKGTYMESTPNHMQDRKSFHEAGQHSQVTDLILSIRFKTIVQVCPFLLRILITKTIYCKYQETRKEAWGAEWGGVGYTAFITSSTRQEQRNIKTHPKADLLCRPQYCKLLHVKVCPNRKYLLILSRTGQYHVW